MKSGEQIGIVSSRYAKIGKALICVTRDFAIEDIHRFRLETKKLRSFLRLASTAKPKENPLEIPANLHRFYRVTGTIRNLQLQQQRMSELSPGMHALLNTPYANFLAICIDEHIKLAKNILKEKSKFPKGKHKLISHLQSKLKRGSIRNFVHHQFEGLTRLLRPASLSDDALHATRKLLKDILYTWPYTKKQINSLPKGSFPDRKEINLIVKLLGSFRDKCEGLDLLHSHYTQQESQSAERVMWRRLENIWWHEKELDRIAIHKLLHKEFVLLLNAKKSNERLLALPVEHLDTPRLFCL